MTEAGLGRRLTSKLGIRAGHTVCLINANSRTVAQLRAESGEFVRFVQGVTDRCDEALVWLRPEDDAFELASALETKIKPAGRIWIIIPKKDVALRKRLDLDWARIQAEVLKTHLVDNKVVSINDEEYGTQFVLRKQYR